jgi:pimeloyl-ACP methyl ester carboxylesterase
MLLRESRMPATAGPAGATARTIDVGGVELFYLDTGGSGTPLVLLHGLSSNANAFGGMIAAGLGSEFRVIAPDQRGRARSGKPAKGYAMADHARDVITLLDALGLQKVVLAGHSFGGYLGIYITATYPERVEKLVVIDAAITGHPRIGVLLKPSLDRLGRVSASADEFLAEIRRAPYMNGVWDDAAEQYFRAELVENPDGTAQSATSAAAVAEASLGVASEPWLHLVQQVQTPTLVLNALEPFGPPGTPPLMDEVVTRATAKAFPNATYVKVPGNHITMLFGEGARALNREILRFVETPA